MMRLRTTLLAPLAFALTLAFAPAAFAGPAQDYVQSKHSTLTTELAKPASAAREKKVNELLKDFFDFNKLTKDALASNYDDLSQDDFNDLKKLVEALVTKNYQKNIEKTLNYDVTFVGDEAVDGDSNRKVRTKVQKRGSDEAPIEVLYTLRKLDDKWMVYDITTDGSSMLRNYRNQFGKVIRRDGFPELLRKLQKKLDET